MSINSLYVNVVNSEKTTRTQRIFVFLCVLCVFVVFLVKRAEIINNIGLAEIPITKRSSGMLKIHRLAGACLMLSLFFVFQVSAQDGFKKIQDKMTEYKLKNGLKLIILERHEVPTVSFQTYVDAGSVNERRGITGMAHMFEHMAFKGTPAIGSKDYVKEKAALDQLESVYEKLRIERLRGEKADQARLAELEAAFKAAQDEASKYVDNNSFTKIINQEGGQGLNAFTQADSTQYFFSLPSNKLELWMLLESERFLFPVLRDFYKERDVVMEERRLRTETQPIGKLIEEVLSIAFKAHPYKEPTIGHMSDLKNFSRTEAAEFFSKYYVASNMTIAIVGDVDPKEVIQMAEKYFGRLPTVPKPEPLYTLEPPQAGERRVTIYEESQPVFVMAYHKPAATDKDNVVFDVIQDIVSQGRTSRLYRNLVRDRKIASFAGGLSNFPGEKYPGLFLFYGLTAPDHKNSEVEEAITAEVERLKNELVDEETLRAVKTRAKAGLIRQLNSNSGLAFQLVNAEGKLGDWRELFKQLDKINAVTAQDIQRVARQYFTVNNRVVGLLEPAQKR
jgi:predicted Zn-dependent peptidase